jgi:ketohexokinase
VSRHILIYTSVPHYPSEDEKLRAQSISHRRGGNCPNTLEVLSQLQAHSSSSALVELVLFAVFPARESAATQMITSSLPGVDLSHCIYRDDCVEAASSYIIRSEESGSRTIVNYNDLTEMSFEEFETFVRDMSPAVNEHWHFEVIFFPFHAQEMTSIDSQ